MSAPAKLQTVEKIIEEKDAELTGLALLRAPFTGDQVSKLPKETRAQIDARKAQNGRSVMVFNCTTCGGHHHKDAVHLDYVGHAALTDRLLDVDPEWSWEPMGTTPEGLPAIAGGLWIKLTVCGVSRYGFGAADGKSGGDAIKEMIGDALRNAAMRFGAALNLWHKGDLHANDSADEPTPKPDPKPSEITDGQKFDIIALAKQANVTIQTICEAANVSEIAELSEVKAASIIKKLNITIEKMKAAQPAPASDILDDEVPY